MTYFLWAGDGRDGISRLFCSYRVRSRTFCTFCGQAMGETESAGCSAAIEQDHIPTVCGRWERRSQRVVVEQDHVHSVGGRWERRSRRVVLQLSRKITYILWAGDGRDGVSKLFYSYRARSCTICGRAMGESESAWCSAAI